MSSILLQKDNEVEQCSFDFALIRFSGLQSSDRTTPWTLIDIKAVFPLRCKDVAVSVGSMSEAGNFFSTTLPEAASPLVKLRKNTAPIGAHCFLIFGAAEIDHLECHRKIEDILLFPQQGVQQIFRRAQRVGAVAASSTAISSAVCCRPSRCA